MNLPGSLGGSRRARSAGVPWSAASFARPGSGVWSKTRLLRSELRIWPILVLLELLVLLVLLTPSLHDICQLACFNYRDHITRR